MSAIVNQLILDRGIQEGIISIEDTKDGLYSEKKMEYKYSQQQTKFENLLSSTRRNVAEFTQDTSKEIKSLKYTVSDIEKSLYQIRDMLNSMLCYSQPEKDDDFKSADPNTAEYRPHLFVDKSEKNYQKMQERYAVEKANDARRASSAPTFISKENK